MRHAPTEVLVLLSLPGLSQKDAGRLDTAAASSRVVTKSKSQMSFRQRMPAEAEDAPEVKQRKASPGINTASLLAKVFRPLSDQKLAEKM